MGGAAPGTGAEKPQLGHVIVPPIASTIVAHCGHLNRAKPSTSEIRPSGGTAARRINLAHPWTRPPPRAGAGFASSAAVGFQNLLNQTFIRLGYPIGYRWERPC